MLRPVIMIGCGGSGQQAVRYARDSVKRHLDNRGWTGDFPEAWQFIGIDTHRTQDNPSIPFLPNNDYVSISLNFPTYRELNQAIEAKFGVDVNPNAFRELLGWRPNPSQVDVPLRGSNPNSRAIGRLAGILAMQDVVRDRLRYAFTQCVAGGPELAEVSRLLGVNVPLGSQPPDPITIVMGSMAGTTGSGIMLDVVDLLRHPHSKGAFPVLVAFTPDIFTQPGAHTMTANAAAFMAEMLSAYWDNENTDNSLIPASVAVNTRGPDSIYFIGRTNIDGFDLCDSKNVFRAVGQTLSAITTSSVLQAMFHDFICVDWHAKATHNTGGYGFPAAQLRGVASSFGSATISIGRDRFRDYLRKLLHRSVLEHLADGFESVATSVLGDAAKSMSGPAKIAELTRQNLDRFIIDCGLNEGNTGAEQISDHFLSMGIIQTRIGQVSNKLKLPLPPAMKQASIDWLHTIATESEKVKAAELSSIDAELSKQLREWGSGLIGRVLRTTTEFSGALSLPVVLSLLQATRAQVLQSSAKFKEQAEEANGQAETAVERGRGRLSGGAKGSIPMSAAPVQETVHDFSQAIVFEWSAKVREKLSVTLESVATTMLLQIEYAVRSSMDRIDELANPRDGRPAVIGSWPKNDGIVPPAFSPSPVEFLLEDFSTWPDTANRLLTRSLGYLGDLPIEPVEAARSLLIRGGFGGDGNQQSQMKPLIWAKTNGDEPVWEPGQELAIEIGDDEEAMSARINAWLMRPETEMLYVLTEGLGSYLMPVHHRTGAAIPEHQQRLETFRQKLEMALIQARPLIEIDNVMNATVHPQALSYTLNIQGFPFGQGHPAREETEQIIQGFLYDAQSVDWAFTGGDTESVLISNFLKYPVNPSVVTSFTQPLHGALSHSSHLLQSSFWVGRRSRTLDKFIPLPDGLRIAAIRGFAVARILGVVTVDPVGQNRISTSEGIFNFPRHLLTETNNNNFLPALLEAMILAFADVPARGKAAFDAYGALIAYGTGGGTASGFEVEGVFAEVLQTGEYGTLQILDQQRADALRNNPQGRLSYGITYLDAILEWFYRLDSLPLHPHSWRNLAGSVDPVDTLTRELLPDLRVGFLGVREALERFKEREANPSGGVF